jgi:hypothetical protein
LSDSLSVDSTLFMISPSTLLLFLGTKVETKLNNKLCFLCAVISCSYPLLIWWQWNKYMSKVVNLVLTYCAVSVVDPGSLGGEVCMLHLTPPPPQGPLLKGPHKHSVLQTQKSLNAVYCCINWH